MSSKPRILTGDTPTGRLHLGHWVGSVKRRVELQSTHDCHFIIANYHAFTTRSERSAEIRSDCLEIVRDYLAMGIDPERATVFLQSEIPAIHELCFLFAMLLPFNRVMRNPTLKDEIRVKDLGETYSFGFPLYAVGQCSDILTFRPVGVPVGEDQVPHLELAREVVRRFHHFYGEVFVEPQPLLTPTPRLPGLDNRKMSKSYGNTIDLSDDADAVTKKVRQMYTDPKRIRADIPGTVEGNPVFMYHDAFNTDTAEVDDLKARYREGKVGDVEVKTKLAKAMNAMLEPMRERRREVAANPGRVREIVVEGSRKARTIAHATMERVRDAVKLRY